MRNWEWNIRNENGSIQNACTLVLYIYNFSIFSPSPSLQLLGVSIRADVPIALDLLLCFWKSLKGQDLTLDDLKEADHVTYSLTKDIIEV